MRYEQLKRAARYRMKPLSSSTAVVIVGVVFLTSACAHFLTRDVRTDPAVENAPGNFTSIIQRTAGDLLGQGQEIFRYDTFGSEAFWGDQLQLHEAILGETQGGVGPGLSPKEALKIGLKVDSGKLPRIVWNAIRAFTFSLESPETTVALLRADSVVGLKGFFDENNRLVSVGITCAICHSTVSNSFADGIGRRLDGWPNRDLNVGGIIALAPNLKPFTDAIGYDEKELRRVFNSWGPGRYDAEFNMDGKGFRPDGTTAATLLPAAFGLAGVNLHTYTGWGSVTHWNAYVANTQMHGKGIFFEPRLNKPEQFPAAVKSGIWNKRDDVDLITSELSALHYYQLSIPAPTAPKVYTMGRLQHVDKQFSMVRRNVRSATSLRFSPSLVGICILPKKSASMTSRPIGLQTGITEPHR